MAKQGTVTSIGGIDNTLIGKVLPASVITHNIGSLVADALRNYGPASVVAVNTRMGRVAVYTQDVADAVATDTVGSIENGDIVFAPVEPNKVSSEYTATVRGTSSAAAVVQDIANPSAQEAQAAAAKPASGPLIAMMKPEKPTFNLQSLINRISDEVDEYEGKTAIILIDQTVPSVRVSVKNTIGSTDLSNAGAEPLALFEVDYSDNATGGIGFGL